ncbi:MAG: hypothetical protein ABIL40_07385 [candidate division WOR-3 bacterium]
MLILIIILLWLLLCLVVANAWKNVGLSYSKGFWNSVLFSPIVGILLGILFVCGRQTIAGDINTPEKKVKEKEDLPQQTSNINFCPYCGTKTNKKICNMCNKDLSNVEKKSDFTCSNCKKDVPGDAIYCWNCGEKLE